MSAIDPFLQRTRIAYFSMEIALRPEIHTYAGGLGVLAGEALSGIRGAERQEGWPRREDAWVVEAG